MRLPARAARQLPDQSTTLRVDSSSTDDSRLRGALLPAAHSITSSARATGNHVASKLSAPERAKQARVTVHCCTPLSPRDHDVTFLHGEQAPRVPDGLYTC